MSFYMKSDTNPTLRKLYRAAKTIAKNANEGDSVMCPCGCLQKFHKSSNAQIFSKNQGDKCKTRFYNRTRSKSNYAFDSRMLHIEQVMSNYIKKHKIENPVQKRKGKEISVIESVPSEPTPDNYIEVLKQTKNASKNACKGARVMCPCGCMKTFIKNTEHHAFSRDNGGECKDNYYTTTRFEETIEMTPEKVLAFKVMHNYVQDNIKELQKLNQKISKKHKLR